MMVAPILYVNERTQGKSKDEILAFIREEEEKIGELKAIMAEPNYEPEMDPTEEVRIRHAEECIKLARAELRRIEAE